MIGFEVKSGGALFSGEARRVLRNAVEEGIDAVAQAGVTMVRTELRRQLQHSTGHYASQIQVSNLGQNRLVTDGGIVYGPWLAGVPAAIAGTRFRGYTHWRLAAQRLQQEAGTIAGHVIAQRLGAL